MARFLPYILHDHYSMGRAKHHYDLRIKYPNRLSVASWALPKHRIPDVHEKTLAMQGHDHDMWWLKADHYVIPKGEFGEGIVKVLQKGMIELRGWGKFHITFVVEGPIMDGKFTLIRPPAFVSQDRKRIKKNPRSGKSWLFIKARPEKD